MKALGSGRSADVYELPDGRILKLLRPDFSALAEVESRNLRALVPTGLSVPRLVDIVAVEGRSGMLFESPRIGRTLHQELSAKPWRLVAHARRFAALHADMHGHSCVELPRLHERLQQEIGCATCLPAGLQRIALRMLESLPDGDVVCHSSFHGDNVICNAAGQVVIDWARAARGNRLGDVAKTLLHYWVGSRAPGIASAKFSAARAIFGRAYLHFYGRIRPYPRAELRAWLVVLGVAAASRRVGISRARTLDFVRRQLALVEPGARAQAANNEERETGR
jgi:hypothetical protein